jgi:C4-dicarboxylate transporter, DctM subunit
MIALFFLLLFFIISVPIFAALGGAALMSTAFFSNIPLIVIPQRMLYSVDSSTLMAGPFFALSGILISRGNLAYRLTDFFKTMFCFLPGGLAIAAAVATAVFGALSGSAVACMMAMGSIMIPALVNAGYNKGFSVGLLTTVTTTDVLIPPSVPMIVYCVVADLSVARLFMAGFVPGFFIILFVCVYSYIYAVKMHYPTESFSWSRLWLSFKRCVFALLFPVVVLGSIYGGICTATEASAVSVFYAFFVEYFIYKSYPIRELKSILITTSLLVGAIFIIIAMGSVLASYWTLEQVPALLAQYISRVIHDRWIFILLVNIFLLIVGGTMDEISAILILVPLFSIAIEQYAISPYHFAIIFLANMNIGLITPPVALSLTTAAAITKLPMMTIFRYCLPFLLIFLLCVLSFSYWGNLILWPVEMLMGPE